MKKIIIYLILFTILISNCPIVLSKEEEPVQSTQGETFDNNEIKNLTKKDKNYKLNTSKDIVKAHKKIKKYEQKRLKKELQLQEKQKLLEYNKEQLDDLK